MNINDLTEELTKKYFPMLTEVKQNKLLSEENGKYQALKQENESLYKFLELKIEKNDFDIHQCY